MMVKPSQVSDANENNADCSEVVGRNFSNLTELGERIVRFAYSRDFELYRRCADVLRFGDFLLLDEELEYEEISLRLQCDLCGADLDRCLSAVIRYMIDEFSRRLH